MKIGQNARTNPPDVKPQVEMDCLPMQAKPEVLDVPIEVNSAAEDSSEIATGEVLPQACGHSMVPLLVRQLLAPQYQTH